MNLIEIVSCYVTQEIEAPSNMSALRDSFIKSGFSEKVISPNKTLYKRGASVALEFNYGSDAIEVQVITELIGDRLKLSVGNWGFPFEPLLMKKRFKRVISSIVEQICLNGVLLVNDTEVSKIEASAKKKGRSAVAILIACILGALVASVLKNT